MKSMGFKSVKRVEIKAETTTPGEVRTTTDANGTRISTSRARRTLPKLDFTVDEDGAVLHGPQRGTYPYFHSGGSFFPSSHESPALRRSDSAGSDGSGERGAAAFHSLHMRDFGVRDGAGASTSPDEGAEGQQLDDLDEHEHKPSSGIGGMKECILNDTRATTLAIKYDDSIGKFVCGSSIERFSGHTGVCRVLGSKKYPIIPHSLQVGDLMRIGSVGLVVCEMNRTDREETQEALTEEEYQFLKEHYLSLPLQQTFHPPEERNEVDGKKEQFRAGETSDEGESEEDHRAGDHGNQHDDGEPESDDNRSPTGVSGMRGKRFCYICYDSEEDSDQNPLVAPCHCKGDTKYVHLECLQRWNNNLDADGTNPNQKVCAVTNTDGLDVCSICKATYLTSVRLDDGRVISLLAKKLPPPYVTFAVVTQHETRNRSTALTNTRFQLSFANLPKNQQVLTIGRPTTNNMTLRYRTVSQLHAKIKYQDNQFHLYDAASSNGSMLFLSKPLELDWNKTMHVKIGRTILTLKAKKRWKWAGGEVEMDEGQEATSPRPLPLTPRQSDCDQRRAQFSNLNQSTNRFIPRGADAASAIADPSAEWLASPFATHRHYRPLNSPTMLRHSPYSSRFSDPDFGNDNDIFATELDAPRNPTTTNRTRLDTDLMSPSTVRSDLGGRGRQATATAAPRSAGRGDAARIHDRSIYNLVDTLSHLSVGNPHVDRAPSSAEGESIIHEF
ncbi:TPA: hypothetical protein N0F65_003474 [Lagenidium giganteum]|uniref:Uncharacterized protein n=1 Tax=Lagenidium giganteum TaxID=4803 RepID=A0AAV2YQ21_9STRA|nr:TPA: hypothetical protein N0F65_003474 [Lagenidium giganteum]